MNSLGVKLGKTSLVVALLSLALCLPGCSPQPGPDKSVGGMILGAGWGAGAGAVIGNQVTNTGDAIGVGAGFGAMAGLLHGIGFDLQEGTQLDFQRQLASLQVQAVANQRHLEKVQRYLDNPLGPDPVGGVYQVFFDEDQTNLRSGGMKDLENIAESIKATSYVRTVHVAGHTDDTGSVKYNESLADARAKTVGAYLASMGIPVVQIDVQGFGASRPIATNSTAAGRQLNRRVDIHISR